MDDVDGGIPPIRVPKWLGAIRTGGRGRRLVSKHVQSCKLGPRLRHRLPDVAATAVAQGFELSPFSRIRQHTHLLQYYEKKRLKTRVQSRPHVNPAILCHMAHASDGMVTVYPLLLDCHGDFLTGICWDWRISCRPGSSSQGAEVKSNLWRDQASPCGAMPHFSGVNLRLLGTRMEGFLRILTTERARPRDDNTLH